MESNFVYQAPIKDKIFYNITVNPDHFFVSVSNNNIVRYFTFTTIEDISKNIINNLLNSKLWDMNISSEEEHPSLTLRVETFFKTEESKKLLEEIKMININIEDNFDKIVEVISSKLNMEFKYQYKYTSKIAPPNPSLVDK